jgi:site-specific recombinase XerD
MRDIPFDRGDVRKFLGSNGPGRRAVRQLATLLEVLRSNPRSHLLSPPFGTFQQRRQDREKMTRLFPDLVPGPIFELGKPKVVAKDMAPTVGCDQQFARRFIVERFGDAPICVRDLAPDDISRFLLRHAHSGSPAMAKMMVTALRSFFRYLFLSGQTESNLAGAVPSVPDWRLAELPKYLTPEEVERVVHAYEQDSPAALRNRAILLLLARLGLRAGEVIALELDDVDWRVGELKVRGKGGQHDRLPLPADVGLAIANYVRHHRPHCSTRRIFVLSKAPYREFAHSTSLSSIVRRAINRVGLHPHFKGAHVLRHSLATGMLRSGASLDEIGEVLRHRAAHTTAIYAKVDIQGLRSLALPWPTKEAVP